MTMSSHYVKIKKRQLKERLSCPLCCKLLREATTISECLHTCICTCEYKSIPKDQTRDFVCRECIYKKLLDEEASCCPVCNVYLGCVPVEKLRPDNNLQDVRTKIFPSKKRKMKTPESITLVSAPARRKERSLSSLVISTPPISAQAGLSKRTKAVARKAAASRSVLTKINSGRDLDVAHDQSDRLDLLERPRRQRNPGGEPSNPMADNDIQNIATQEVARQRTGKSTSWELLACLAEAANRTETSQLPVLGLAAVKTEETDKYRSIKNANGTKRRSSGSINSVRKKESGKVHPGHNSKVARKLHATGPERISVSRKQRTVPGSMDSGSSMKYERRSNPVWFALLASENQVGDNALPQIQIFYLRVKDGNVPVSYVKKYIVKKLELKNESEVEITCCGQPIVPSLSLYSLVEFWIRYAASSDRLSSIQRMDHERAVSKFSSGSPYAEDFVMVLIYGRKTPRG